MEKKKNNNPVAGRRLSPSGLPLFYFRKAPLKPAKKNTQKNNKETPLFFSSKSLSICLKREKWRRDQSTLFALLGVVR